MKSDGFVLKIKITIFDRLIYLTKYLLIIVALDIIVILNEFSGISL